MQDSKAETDFGWEELAKGFDWDGVENWYMGCFDDLCRHHDALAALLARLEEMVPKVDIAPVIVVFDEGLDMSFEITGQEVVFEQDAVLQCLMPAFNLALGLRVIWRAARVLHAFALQPLSQIARDVT